MLFFLNKNFWEVEAEGTYLTQRVLLEVLGLNRGNTVHQLWLLDFVDILCRRSPSVDLLDQMKKGSPKIVPLFY